MYQAPARQVSLDFPLYSAYSSHNIDRRKDTGIVPPCGSQQTPIYLEAPIRAGLRTPPEDDMSTTYQYPPYQNFANKQDAAYASMTAAGSGYAGSSAQYISSSTQPRPYSSLNYTSQHSSTSISKPLVQDSLPPYNKPPSPEPSSRSNTLAPSESVSRRKGTVVPNLQIPSTITSSGGSLAEFAAQITCLFWFESTETLRKAEQLDPTSSVKRLRSEAIPTSGFRKWVVSILSTTQVTSNVILLALLFIYRLKTINPVVNGRPGSEYRLLTVALMLGNKFLDDNTYTNKTWAEVSGISVTEIHVMEVEFLSNMRYSLLASKEQWEEWQEKLGKFWTYCDRAMKTPVTLPSPTGLPNPHSVLPTPPTTMQSSPSHTNLYSTSGTLGGTITYNQQWPTNNYSVPALSSLPPPVPNLQPITSRKRAFEDDMGEPAAKRVTRSAPATMVPFQPAPAPVHMRSDAPRLPVPNLTISTTQALNSSYPAVANFAHSSPSVLPPLNGNRALSAYPTTPSWTTQLPMLTPTAGQQGPHSAGGYGTPTRRQSPHSVQDLLSIGSSPISAIFPGYNPGHISPSVFLQQRASPYKPVRHVNALLYPPPSASMHNYSANIDQMHYQPLGKRNDYRAGIVPDYTSNSAYQWPVLPQPNFHV
ncbi:hypothetical protein B7463_g4663, partial [Scytalidium lignicola]